MFNHLYVFDWWVPFPYAIREFHGIDGIGITYGCDPVFGTGGTSLSIGPLKLDLSYTPDLPDFLDKALLTPAEKYTRDTVAKERRESAIRKRIARENREVDKYNATHADKKGYTAYVSMPDVKFRTASRYPFVISGKDYSIEKGQAFPIYDSKRRFIGNGFPLEINELEPITPDNVFEIYERDINTVWKHVDDEKDKNKWEKRTRKNHIYPVPKNPFSKFFKRRSLLRAYNNMLPFDNKYGTYRRTIRTDDFLAINPPNARNEMGSDGWHFIVPRSLSRAVVQDAMDGDMGPYVEANIVPQVGISYDNLVDYPMINFGHASVFRDYPKGLEGKKMREKEALDEKLGHLPLAVYNHMDRNGVIDQMHRNIDDKYEEIRRIEASRR